MNDILEYMKKRTMKNKIGTIIAACGLALLVPACSNDMATHEEGDLEGVHPTTTVALNVKVAAFGTATRASAEQVLAASELTDTTMLALPGNEKAFGEIRLPGAIAGMQGLNYGTKVATLSTIYDETGNVVADGLRMSHLNLNMADATQSHSRMAVLAVSPAIGADRLLGYARMTITDGVPALGFELRHTAAKLSVLVKSTDDSALDLSGDKLASAKFSGIPSKADYVHKTDMRLLTGYLSTTAAGVFPADPADNEIVLAVAADGARSDFALSHPADEFAPPNLLNAMVPVGATHTVANGVYAAIEGGVAKFTDSDMITLAIKTPAHTTYKLKMTDIVLSGLAEGDPRKAGGKLTFLNPGEHLVTTLTIDPNLSTVTATATISTWAEAEADADLDPGYTLKDGVMLVTSAKGLKAFAAAAKEDLKLNLKLMNNVTLPAVGEGQSNWEILGTTYDDSYTGTFDGNGKTITGLTIDGSSGHCAMFGVVGMNGAVKNLLLADVKLRNSADTGHLAVIAARNFGTVKNCAVLSGSVENGATGTNNSLTGGLVAVNETGGKLFACFNGANITGSSDYTGGLIGFNSGTMVACGNTGMVKGTACVGGLNGYNDRFIIACWSTGAVSGSESTIGTIIGAGSNVGKNCYPTNEMSDLATDGSCVADADYTALNAAIEGMNVAISLWNNKNRNACEYYFKAGTTAKSDVPTYTDTYDVGFEMKDGVMEISSVKGLNAFAAAVAVPQDGRYLCAKLTADITLPAVGEGQSNWPSISNTREEYYCGTFDGNGKKITGLTINYQSDFCGLFGGVDGDGVVKNLLLAGVKIKNSNAEGHLGAIAGYNGGTIENCAVVSGSVVNLGTELGKAVTGALVGRNFGKLIGCFNDASITGSSNCTGGLAGENRGIMMACGNIGAVKGTTMVGGLIGECHNNVIACWNTGAVSGTGAEIGTIIGRDATSGQFRFSVTHCYPTNTVSDIASGGSCDAIRNYTALNDQLMTINAALKTEGCAYGWKAGAMTATAHPTVVPIKNATLDVDLTYDVASSTYTVFKAEGLMELHAWLTGSGSAPIDGAGDGYTGENKLAVNIKLDADLIMTNIIWKPITPYSGTFDGNNKKITGLEIWIDANNAGFFGELEKDGVVKNLTLVDFSITTKDGDKDVKNNIGGIAGLNKGSIENCHIMHSGAANTSNIGTRKCDFVGGIVGSNAGSITACSNSANIIGRRSTGGIVGTNSESSTITACVNHGHIYGFLDEDFGFGEDVGGISGTNASTITACGNTGIVRSDCERTGGVAGANSGNISGSWNTGDVSSIAFKIGSVVGFEMSGNSISGCHPTNTPGDGMYTAVTNYTELNAAVATLNTALSGGSWKWTAGSPAATKIPTVKKN